jgi:hypothetical protein
MVISTTMALVMAAACLAGIAITPAAQARRSRDAPLP